MPQLIITINDNARLPVLKSAIRQLRGVDKVSTVRTKSRKKQSNICELHKKLQNRLTELSLLKDGWDGKDSKAICSECIQKLNNIIAKADGNWLTDWVIFPEAHGNLYLDYAHDSTTAGITLTPEKIIYFISKDGTTYKSDGIAFTARNLNHILKKTHE